MMTFTDYERTNKESGLIFKDKDVIERQNKVLSYLLKKAGSSLIKGQSIMNISLPVTIFDKRTLLQVTAYEFSYAPYYLNKAFYAITPLEKIKFV